MTPTDVIRAWTDPEFRARLDPADLDRLPEHPAALVELDDADLEQVAGGGICRTGRARTSSCWSGSANARPS